MLNGFKNLVSRASHQAKVEKGTNGHGANGHGTNGHGANGHGTNGHGNNGSEAHANGNDDTYPFAAPSTSIKIPDGFLWTLEVRQDQHILGSMHSPNPFVLISFFRDYSMLYGEPAESYAVWLRHKDSNRGAPLQYQQGRSAWIEFLRKIDPEIDQNLDAVDTTSDRTSMLDPGGSPTHPDAVLEQAFGLAKQAS